MQTGFTREMTIKKGEIDASDAEEMTKRGPSEANLGESEQRGAESTRNWRKRKNKGKTGRRKGYERITFVSEFLAAYGTQ